MYLSRGLLFKLDGKNLDVMIPSNLEGCREWFEATIRDCEEGKVFDVTVNMQDIGVTQIVNGVLEYTIVMWGTVTSIVERKFKHDIFNTMLVFKTNVASDSFDDMTDSVRRDTLMYEDIEKTLSEFSDNISQRMGERKNETVGLVFPRIVTGVEEDSVKVVRNYEFPPSDTLPVDLLTWRVKRRGFEWSLECLFSCPFFEKREEFMSKREGFFMTKNNLCI